MCLGLPGSLPVLNDQAVELATRTGMAGREFRPSKWARKNDFYPDQPKDYQISQYDVPLNVDGRLELPMASGWDRPGPTWRRTPASPPTPAAPVESTGADYALVEDGRSGGPLVEVVSAPESGRPPRPGPTWASWGAMLVASGASDGQGEGSMRVDANVSAPVRPTSLRHPLRDQEPQLGALSRPGHRVRGRTSDRSARVRPARHAGDRQWDEGGPDRALRSKEEANDYRYFPEPDLVPLAPDAAWQERCEATRAMPSDRRALWPRPSGDHRPTPRRTRSMPSSTGSRRARDGGGHAGVPVRWPWPGPPTRSRPRARPPADSTRARSPSLLTMESGGQLSATQSKAVLERAARAGGGDPASIAKEMGFEAMGSDAWSRARRGHRRPHRPVGAFRRGDDKLMGFFTGAVMKATRGRRTARSGGGAPRSPGLTRLGDRKSSKRRRSRRDLDPGNPGAAATLRRRSRAAKGASP